MPLRSRREPNRYCSWRTPVTPRTLTLSLATLIAGAWLGVAAQTPAPPASSAATPPASVDPVVAQYKRDLVAEIDGMKDHTQQMVDSVFSFGELGFQEHETGKYITGILEKSGFRIERGIAGIPTAWTATWGSGKPVIALGSDIDGIPQASQKPGVAYRDALIDGAPGHGEGHNSGVPLNVTAALALKKVMERNKLSGTIRLWPGVAEELLATKAYFVRAGVFKDVDVVLFAHVGTNLTANWGDGAGNGLVSVEYTFRGESAHAAGAPWRGRSALDAVELMNAGWNFRREHLRFQQRSHYVITNGGDQPNVVPPVASVWYYFRELDYERISEMRKTGDRIAQGAATMTDTTVTSRTLGAAWPQHFSKPVAEAMFENIKRVGLPQWSEDDQRLAKAVQKELKVAERGLATELAALAGPGSEEGGAGSDDIGDVSWNVPTVRLRYPSNIPNLPGHNWSNAITMATPIAHKGVVAGAKVLAMTMLDLITKPELIDQSWKYFREVQTKDTKYQPSIAPTDKPPIWMNKRTRDTYLEQMRKC